MPRNRWYYNPKDRKFYTEDEWKALKAAEAPKRTDPDLIKTWEKREALKHRRWIWCQVQRKVVPYGEHLHSTPDNRPANIAHGYIPDEMPATKHPCDKKYYTSASKFRAATKAHGREEVGTAFENGYHPEKEQEADQKRYDQRLHEVFRERLNSGPRN